VGYLEDLDAMDIPQETKDALRAAHLSEVDPLRAREQQLARENKRDKVEEEIKSLGALFADDDGNIASNAISLLKFTRRLYLSDTDADPNEEPGVILLADHELGLSGDEATGAHTQQAITAAGAVREFIKLLPTKEDDGKLKLHLSDVALLADDHSREPGSGAVENSDDEHSQRADHLSSATGLERPKRTRRRYSGGRPVAAGGDN
jgi:hypothetical protein